MKTAINTFCIIFISLLLITCKKYKLKSPCDCSNNELVVQDSDLEGKWIFRGLVTASEKQEYFPTLLFSSEMNIEFLQDSVVKVRGAVNSGGANYQVFENKCMILNQLGGTQLGGPHYQSDWEHKYFNGLSNVECYKVKNDKLTMYYKNGTDYEMFEFKRD